MKLKKFWIELKNGSSVCFVGVTAWTEEDAFNLVRERIEKVDFSSDLRSVKEVFSINDLDQGHILPNMDEFVSRGIWFPTGFR